MRFRITTIGLLWAGLSSAAHGAEIIGQRGGWDVFRGETSCGMSLEYEGPGETRLVFIKYADDRLGMAVTNSNWSAKKDVAYDVSYVLDGQKYTGTPSMGTNDYRRAGFVNLFASSFEQHFAAGRSLAIYLGEEKIDQLSLSGTTAALSLVNQCLVGVRATVDAEAREMARWAHLPRDPFAKRCAPEAVTDSVAGEAPVALDPPVERTVSPPTTPSTLRRNSMDERADPDVAAPLRAAQAARPSQSGSEEQFKSLFRNWARIEAAGARKVDLCQP